MSTGVHQFGGINASELGIYGIFFLILVREARQLVVAAQQKKSGGTAPGEPGPNCAMARERADNISAALNSLRDDMAKRNTIVSDFAPRLDSTRDACLDLGSKLSQNLDNIRENTAETTVAVKALVRSLERRDAP